MKYIDAYSKDIFDNQINEQKFNRQGETIKNDSEKVFAKYVNNTTHNGENIQKYYVLVHNNIPYDPYGTDSHRERTLQTTLRSTSKQAFDDYITYLKTKNRLYMTRTQRNFAYV
jgi:hypothetical protein